MGNSTLKGPFGPLSEVATTLSAYLTTLITDPGVLGTDP